MQNKFCPFINVIGPSTRLTCWMLINLYLLYETSCDKYQAKIGVLYQVAGTLTVKTQRRDYSLCQSANGNCFKKRFSTNHRKSESAPLFSEYKSRIQYDFGRLEIKSFPMNNGYLADSFLFRQFTYYFIKGIPTGALNGSHTVSILKIAQKKYSARKTPSIILSFCKAPRCFPERGCDPAWIFPVLFCRNLAPVKDLYPEHIL
jgi:hypothetical protein